MEIIITRRGYEKSYRLHCLRCIHTYKSPPILNVKNSTVLRRRWAQLLAPFSPWMLIMMMTLSWRWQYCPQLLSHLTCFLPSSLSLLSKDDFNTEPCPPQLCSLVVHCNVKANPCSSSAPAYGTGACRKYLNKLFFSLSGPPPVTFYYEWRLRPMERMAWLGEIGWCWLFRIWRRSCRSKSFFIEFPIRNPYISVARIHWWYWNSKFSVGSIFTQIALNCCERWGKGKKFWEL